MTDYTNSRLLYRGTRDGFSGAVYHRLGSVPNTVTIIQSHTNYVFGGYTSVALNASTGYHADPTAFLFSLRRNGTINNLKLRSGGTSGDPTAKFSLYVYPSYFQFGYNDLYVNDNSFSTGSSTTNLCYTFDCPVGCSYGDSCSQTYLAGRFSTWYTDEIEVFEMLSPTTTTVQPGK
jgi:hypothetical protein